MKSFLGGIAHTFEDRNFRIYSIGSIVSWLSFFVQSVAVAWTAWDLTHSTEWLAIVALADAVPNIILIPIGGVIADRSNRLKVQLTSYCFATAQAALLAGFAFSGHLTIGYLTLFAAMHGALQAFAIPSSYGLLPRFIDRERLPSAIAVASAYAQLGIFLGPAVAGWVIQNFGTATAFATNAAGYGIYLLCIALLRTPASYQRQAPSGKSFFADFADGLAAIAQHRGVLWLISLMLFGDVLATSIRQLASAFSDLVFHAGIDGLSTLLAAGGIGATLAALWLAQGGAARTALPTILSAFLAFLCAVAGLMLSPSLVAAAIAMVGVGCAFEICRTGAFALLQISVPDAIRGRVMSTQFVLMRLAGATGVAVIGASADFVGLRLPVLCVVAVALIVWIVAFLRRDRIAAAFISPGS